MTGPRVSEKTVQAQIVHALRAIGAKVYVIGTVHAGEPGRKSTRQTPGIPDLLVHLPEAHSPLPDPRSDAAGLSVMRDGKWTMGTHQLWIECKAKGGKLRPEQAAFRDFCELASVPHLVGGLDEVLAYLQERGYVREVAHYRQTTPKGHQPIKVA